MHSPRHKGFFYVHVGWIFSTASTTRRISCKIADFAKYPGTDVAAPLRGRAAVVLAVSLCSASAGWSGLVVGFFWSTVLVYHGTFCINSLAHVHGSQALRDR